jgi:molybdopterin-binding protein
VAKASANGRVRLDIAFEGGQIVGGSVSDEAVFDLETEDGTYVVALRKVVYVRRTSREMHIGFGTSA